MSLSDPSRFPLDLIRKNQIGDVVATSDAVWPELLIDAYEHGIFPWPSGSGEPIPWCCPKRRALLFFSDLKLPRSLEKTRRNSTLRFSRDEAFTKVIEACAEQPRPGQAGTWITPEMTQAYCALHRIGRAHSVEAWRGEILVGGIYGVDAGGAFSAESMFYREPNASKLSLLELIDRLKEKGREWLDIQQLTPHLERLGAREIKRSDFLHQLSLSQLSSTGKIF